MTATSEAVVLLGGVREEGRAMVLRRSSATVDVVDVVGAVGAVGVFPTVVPEMPIPSDLKPIIALKPATLDVKVVVQVRRSDKEKAAFCEVYPEVKRRHYAVRRVPATLRRVIGMCNRTHISIKWQR